MKVGKTRKAISLDSIHINSCGKLLLATKSGSHLPVVTNYLPALQFFLFCYHFNQYPLCSIFIEYRPKSIHFTCFTDVPLANASLLCHPGVSDITFCQEGKNSLDVFNPIHPNLDAKQSIWTHFRRMKLL